MPEAEPAELSDATPRAATHPKTPKHAGWSVVAALFIILMASSGLAFYNLQVFLHALTHEGIIQLNVVSWAIGFFFVINGIAGLGVSYLLDRFPAPAVIAVGSVISGASLAALGQVANRGELFVVFGIFGLGFAASSLIPAMTVVTRWFVERRSVAVSIVSTGLSLGGILITPLCAKWIEAYGIAAVTPWLGLAYAVGVLPLALLFVRDAPASVETSPSQTETTAREVNAAGPAGVPFREAVTSRYFIWLGVAYIAIMMAQVGVLQHLYNAVAIRVDTEFGRTIIRVLAGSSVVGRFSGGFLLLRAPIRPVTFVLVAAQGVSLACLAFAETPLGIIASVVLFGLTVGNLLMIQPLLLAAAFGVRDYGRIYSTSQLVTTVGYASAAGVIGFLYNRFGRYDEAFLFAACASTVALASLLIAGRPKDDH